MNWRLSKVQITVKRKRDLGKSKFYIVAVAPEQTTERVTEESLTVLSNF